MWVIKSRTHRLRERVWKATKCFFKVGGLTFLLFSAFMKLGIEKKGPSHPLPWEELWTVVPYVALLAVVVGACAALGVAMTSHSSGIFICPRCGRSRYSVGSRECDCGGRYVEIEKLKWEEEPKDKPNPNT
jgi:ribosomal protein L37E